MIDPARAETTLALFHRLGLVTVVEVDGIRGLFADRYPFADALRRADSLHVHVRVDDVSALPHDAIKQAGGVVENQRDGYVKFAFAGGTNVILSSIDIAQDDLLPEDEPREPRPFVDHVGIDLRQESDDVRRLFDAVPAQAQALGWRHAAQGSDDSPVYCCHTSVGRKHWVYPTADVAFARPVELAFGALQIYPGKMGCDLRPIDPAHPRAAQAVCGDHGAPAAASPAAGYYDPADLGRFGEVGLAATPVMNKFWEYYKAATDTDGALDRKTKALIGLAVAHSKQCPYCIDAYTGTCLTLGATVEQMHEAVHVAAALAAGIELVHATQMRAGLRRRGAI